MLYSDHVMKVQDDRISFVVSVSFKLYNLLHYTKYYIEAV